MNVAIASGVDMPFGTNLRTERVREWALHYQRFAKAPTRRWRMTLLRGERALHAARERGYRIGKRAFDFAFATALLVLASPLLLFIALSIKLNDGGPVLYWQKRVGRWGELFDFPKFRSMIIGADRIVDSLIDRNHHGDSITFKIKRDPRVTWIGRFIRRFSLDELPQLWCILRGQMSLVGPRPALPREVNLYTQIHRRRLDVRPGLTCIWQVSGRADVPFERQVQMDVDYVLSHNFWLDLKRVAATLPAVIGGRGAY
jgi:lipopolysaccharide/colanic/teichoic acid biosynthesis glycosyltransferase